ncbi:hypothetical protein CEXT_322031, partial [Caerostris extrusa]
CDCGKYFFTLAMWIQWIANLPMPLGYVQMNGYCYATTTTSMVTTEEPSTTAPTTTLRVCECGKYSHSCYLDTMDRKLCLCHFGYVQINGYCYAATTTSVVTTEQPSTTAPTTTLRDCYCGMNSRSCRLNWFGRKMCDCYHGYEQVDGYCIARTTTERPVTTERDCYCGENSHSCNFDWFGRKVCDCRFGYVQMDGYCSEICNDDKCLYGKCQVMGYGYECRCYEGYTGSRCEKKDSTRIR